MSIKDYSVEDVVLYIGKNNEKNAGLGSEMLGCVLMDCMCSKNMCSMAWLASYVAALPQGESSGNWKWQEEVSVQRRRGVSLTQAYEDPCCAGWEGSKHHNTCGDQ